ncbi:MAG: hypothetical protein JNM27_21410 [Leptospirales bacterium]|nr:hypothetical protein [Leptospirales bacterium]
MRNSDHKQTKSKRPRIRSQTILLFVFLGGTLFALYLPWFYLRTPADHIPLVPLVLTFLALFAFLFYALRSGLRLVKDAIEPEAPPPTPSGNLIGNPDLDLNPVNLLIGLLVWLLISLIVEFVILALFSAAVYMISALAAGINWILLRTFRYVLRTHGSLKSRSLVSFWVSFGYALLATIWLALLLVGPRMLILGH